MFVHQGLYFGNVDPLAIGKMDFIAAVVNPGCGEQGGCLLQNVGQK